MVVLFLKYHVVIQRTRLGLLPHWTQSLQKEEKQKKKRAEIFALLYIQKLLWVNNVVDHLFFYPHMSPQALHYFSELMMWIQQLIVSVCFPQLKLLRQALTYFCFPCSYNITGISINKVRINIKTRANRQLSSLTSLV